MKWFQHQSDASDDIKIKRLERKFSLTGYAVYFKIIEKVAKESNNFRLSLKKYPIQDLAEDLKVETKVFDNILTFMDEIGLIVLRKSEIYLPNMRKYASNWVRRNDVGTTEERQSDDGATTAQEKKRIEEKRKEESVLILKMNNWNGSQSSPIQNFKPENIIKRHTFEKVEKLVAYYGPKNNGFSQFLEALKK